MAAPALTSTLDRLRKSGFVALIGYALVALVGLWLIVNFVKEPTEFVNVGLIGLTNGAIYGLVALGYTLVYGILQLINFAHGDVFALVGPRREHDHHLGDRAGQRTPRCSRSSAGSLPTLVVIMIAVRDHQRHDRVRRLPAPAACAAARGADHRRRDVVHRPEHLARALRRQLPVGADRSSRARRRSGSATSPTRGTSCRPADHRSRARAADLVRAVDAPGQGDARGRAGHRGLGDDGHQREPDDLGHVRDRRRAGRRRRASSTCSSSTCATTRASSSG